MAFVNRGSALPGLLLVAYERDTWMLAITGPEEYGTLPTDFTQMLAAAEQLLPDIIMTGLRDATPVGQISISRSTAAAWRRSGRSDIPRRFYRLAAEQVAPVWAANRAHDRAAPADTRGSRRHRIRSWAQHAALNAAANDIVVAERLFRVRGMIDPPTRLQEPALLLRILLSNLRHPRPTRSRTGPRAADQPSRPWLASRPNLAFHRRSQQFDDPGRHRRCGGMLPQQRRRQ